MTLAHIDRNKGHHVNSTKPKRTFKKGKVTKGKLAGHSVKHSGKRGDTRSLKLTEKSGSKGSKMKGEREKENENLESSEGTISHLKPDKKREKVKWT